MFWEITPDLRSSFERSKYKLQFYQLWLNLVRFGKVRLCLVWLVYFIYMYICKYVLAQPLRRLCYYPLSCKVTFFHLWKFSQVAIILKLEHCGLFAFGSLLNLFFHISLWFIFLTSEIMCFVRGLFKKNQNFRFFFQFSYSKMNKIFKT